MTPQPRPEAEVQVEEALVRALLAEQHPDLARLPLSPLASGWDNVSFRLGDGLVVRLPRRELAAALVPGEHRWLPVLAPRLPLPIPVPVRRGQPAEGYPWRWSVVPWLPGRTAADEPPADPDATAEALGRFFAALHVPAPADAPVNPYRGGPLTDRDRLVHERARSLDGLVDGGAVLALWRELVDAPPHAGPPVWLHGDPHPMNLLVDDGRLSAVIDWGDLCAGDPATDLAVAWMLLPAVARPVLRAAAGDVDDATWARARGWALALGLAFLAHSADDAPMAALAQRTLDAVTAEDSEQAR